VKGGARVIAHFTECKEILARSGCQIAAQLNVEDSLARVQAQICLLLGVSTLISFVVVKPRNQCNA
jgi:hypothetical protein